MGAPPSAGAAGARDGGLRLSSAQGRWVLLATVLGSAVASIDATVVGIALPAIGRDFGAGLPVLQWVVTAYTLTLAGLLLLAGTLGDKFGRKRVFLAGVAWFAVASLLSGVAPDAGFLIVARALQGAGAALLTPGSLAILQATFAPGDRGRAIGAWSGLSGVGTAVGPFLGGWLVQAVSWRLIFAINLPLAALVIAVSWRHVPETRDPGATGPVDVIGGALVTLGLIGITYGLIEGPSSGWTGGPVLAALLGGGALGAAFAWREHRAAAPMLPLRMFSSAQFTVTNVVTFVVYGAIGGTLFLLPIQLQEVSGYTALEAGISMLPVTVIMLALSSRSGALAGRIGPRLQMSAGPVVVATGLALFSRITASGGYLTEVLPAVAVFGFGLAVTVAPLTATVLAAVPAEHAGMASAVNNDVARAAALIAVALLPAAGGITGEAFRHPELLSAGFGSACLIAAGLCAAGGLLAAVTLRNPARPAAVAGPLVHCGLDRPAARLPLAADGAVLGNPPGVAAGGLGAPRRTGDESRLHQLHPGQQPPDLRGAARPDRRGGVLIPEPHRLGVSLPAEFQRGVGQQEIAAGHDRVQQGPDDRSGLVVVQHEVQDAQHDERDRLAEVERGLRGPHDGGGLVRVGVDVAGDRRRGAGQERAGVGQDDRVVVDIHHPRVRPDGRGDLMGVLRGGQARADVQELPHPGTGHETDRAAEERPVGPGHLHDARMHRAHMLSGRLVDPEVVLAAQPVVPHPRVVSDARVDVGNRRHAPSLGMGDDAGGEQPLLQVRRERPRVGLREVMVIEVDQDVAHRRTA